MTVKVGVVNVEAKDEFVRQYGLFRIRDLERPVMRQRDVDTTTAAPLPFVFILLLMIQTTLPWPGGIA